MTPSGFTAARMPLAIAFGVGAAAFLLCLGPRVEAAPVFQRGLEDAVNAALERSERLRAAELEVEAARQRAAARGGLLWPRISIDADWRRVSEVPEIVFDPARSPLAFGDNESWSYGPAASWLVWDWGSRWLEWRAGKATADAKAAEADLVRRQIRFSTSVAYSGVQMAIETVRLLADSLDLATSQHADIVLRQRTGSASRLDVLQAHQEVLSGRREFTAARTALGACLQDLFRLTGVSATTYDTTFPIDAIAAKLARPEDPAPTLIVELDSVDSSVTEFESGVANAVLDPLHPSVASPALMADSAVKTANSLRASGLPAVTVSGRMTREYPNGPIPEDISQNTIAFAASMPIFEGGRRKGAWSEQAEQAAAFTRRRDAAAADLARDWRKAQDAVASLRVQLEVDREAAVEAEELSRLTYDAFKTGQARLIEVQAANLKALQAKVRVARTKTEMLIQFAFMRSLAKGE